MSYIILSLFFYLYSVQFILFFWSGQSKNKTPKILREVEKHMNAK